VSGHVKSWNMHQPFNQDSTVTPSGPFPSSLYFEVDPSIVGTSTKIKIIIIISDGIYVTKYNIKNF